MTDEDFPWRGHNAEFYAAVGYLCQQWNVLELLYTSRASDIMGLPRSKHDLIFRHLGIVAIGEFMNDYAELHIKSKDAREQLAHVTKYVNCCRINRNAIVHGWADFTEPRENGAVRIRSKADQRRSKKSEFQISVTDVRRICDDIETGGRLIVSTSFLFDDQGVETAKKLMGENWHARLHAKPPLPKLVAVNPQTPPRPPSRPRSSRG